MREREEEMELMREHTFKESDINQDRLISLEEFLTETKRDEFKQDPGWDTLDQNPEMIEVNEEDFKAYEERRVKEIEDQLKDGIHPPGYENDGHGAPAADQPGVEMAGDDTNHGAAGGEQDHQAAAAAHEQQAPPFKPNPDPPKPRQTERPVLRSP